MNRTDENKHAPLDGATEANAAKATDGEAKIGKKRRLTRPLIVLAVCVCAGITLAAVAGVNIFTSHKDEKKPDENGLYSFSDYKDLYRIIDDIWENQQPYVHDPDMIVYDAAGTDAESADVKTPVGSPSAKAGDSPAHSDTYTQVDGVDEADIVKTDGNYIYYVSVMENQVVIAEAKDGKTRRLSAVREKGDCLIEDIYIHGDQLIVVSETRNRVLSFNEGRVTRQDSDDDGSSSDGADPTPDTDREKKITSVTVTTYDISDRAKPERTGSYTQSGHLLSSRMSKGQVILVTSQYLNQDPDEDRYPVRSFEDGHLQKLDIADIKCIPHTASASYAVVGMIDPSKGKMSADTTRTIAVLGGSDQIYCSADELYITSTTYEERLGGGSLRYFIEDHFEFTDPETTVLKVKLADRKISFAALGSLPGTVNDQFSMDAKDGYFRIATTSERGGEDVNNLFILDGKLNEVGSVRNFARDEHIEAVRYIGDLAYVITYEETDPLFIIDLADPADPQIRGHVKISGFSTLLVPADADHILGFGFSTETTEFGEALDGLKLALFDVSDPNDPKVADSKEFSDVSSEIQYDHKALLAGPDGSYYAIPYDRYNFDRFDDAEDSEAEGGPATDIVMKPAETSSGIMVFDVRDGNIRLVKDFPSKSNIRRCIYIGDWIYGICSDDSIEAYRLPQ